MMDKKKNHKIRYVPPLNICWFKKGQKRKKKSFIIWYGRSVGKTRKKFSFYLPPAPLKKKKKNCHLIVLIIIIICCLLFVVLEKIDGNVEQKKKYLRILETMVMAMRRHKCVDNISEKRQEFDTFLERKKGGRKSY